MLDKKQRKQETNWLEKKKRKEKKRKEKKRKVNLVGKKKTLQKSIYDFLKRVLPQLKQFTGTKVESNQKRVAKKGSQDDGYKWQKICHGI